MKYKNKKKNLLGFTLVELLVVIAIIGIITSVGVIGVNSARAKARRGAMKQIVSVIKPILILCAYDDKALCPDCDLYDGGPAKIPAIDKSICSGEQNWPPPADGWEWNNVGTSANQDYVLSIHLIDSSPGEFILCAPSTGCGDIVLPIF